MALKVTYEEKEEPMATNNWKADRDLYLDATKSKAVEAGDPAAAFLLTRAGRVVKGELVVRYKLKNKPRAKAQAKSADKAVKKGEDK
jgi:hypothetical protein